MRILAPLHDNKELYVNRTVFPPSNTEM